MTTASHDAAGPDRDLRAATGHAAQPLAMTVLYEDDQLLAVEKPAGLVTHPTYKHPDGTLTDLVFARQAARGERRPWLLHRLDRETSGIVLFAKTDTARRAVVRQFERRTVRKQYLAVTSGVPPMRQVVIEGALARDPADRRRTIVVSPEHGQRAATRNTVLATACASPLAPRDVGARHVAPEGGRGGEGHRSALILAEPLTGRTHQIRAHLASIGAPLAGDTRYLPAASHGQEVAPRALLHAWRLTVTAPVTGEPLTLVARIPADLRAAALALGLDSGLDMLGSLPLVADAASFAVTLQVFSMPSHHHVAPAPSASVPAADPRVGPSASGRPPDAPTPT